MWSKIWHCQNIVLFWQDPPKLTEKKHNYSKRWRFHIMLITQKPMIFRKMHEGPLNITETVA